ncbi:hypothetical protein JAAARDRAFT_42925 [Jaapia argillacea MUCL 33604]|uniref:Phosphoribulokinase/uridine kinase domain-containing protein n=1 Tax=Jaapia argillacea MUCL 33604 TaxID=933084 RepID=A0A067PEC5_9AGAM|nr:hypothetical protein JAAARDRAFT_42925 [Jaapia argillacea MUCL 33604]
MSHTSLPPELRLEETALSLGDASLKTRVIVVGIGGATCSGKTTLAKHLRRILPNSIIIHQDDFAPPQELIPMHPVYNVQDWDDPVGAIDWQRLVAFLKYVRQTGNIPGDHRSHDHLNEQKEVPIGDGLAKNWREHFEKAMIEREKRGAEEGERIIWGLLDGFLLYWDPDVISQLDVRIFLRVPHDVLKQRREERHGYHTAEGALWRDPPDYFHQVVYPAYVTAHADSFENGDVERGKPTGKVEGLIVLEPLKAEKGMESIVDSCCEVLNGLFQ